MRLERVYDYGARHYDPALGRWFVVDPLAELAPDITPYRYGFNNPILFYDAFGLWERTRSGGWTTDNADDIRRFLDMTSIESSMEDGDISTDQMYSFIEGEENGDSFGGRLSNNGILLDDMTAVSKGGSEYKVSDSQMFKTKSKIEYAQTFEQNHKDFEMLSDPMYNLNMNFAKIVQRRGGQFTKVGAGLTLSGKGAIVGIPMATVGSIASTIGDAHEILTALYFGDTDKVKEGAAFYFLGEAIKVTLKRIPYADDYIWNYDNKVVE